MAPISVPGTAHARAKGRRSEASGPCLYIDLRLMPAAPASREQPTHAEAPHVPSADGIDRESPFPDTDLQKHCPEMQALTENSLLLASEGLVPNISPESIILVATRVSTFAFV
jgi:hypothetical protein